MFQFLPRAKSFIKLRSLGIRALLDDRSESMNYKVRDCLQNKEVDYVAKDKETAE